MMGTTQRQQDALDFIRAYSEENKGVMPSNTEIAEHLGLSSRSAAHRVVHALIDRGLIRRIPNRARAIEVIGDMPAWRDHFGYTEKEWAIVCAAASIEGKSVKEFIREASFEVASLIQDGLA